MKDPNHALKGNPYLPESEKQKARTSSSTPWSFRDEVAGTRCRVFDSWSDLLRCVQGGQTCGFKIAPGSQVLVYQGTHGGRFGSAVCNAEDQTANQVYDHLETLSSLFQTAYVSSSCFSTDLQRKKIIQERVQPPPESIDRLCMMTASPFGAVSVVGREIPDILKLAKPGEPLQTLLAERADAGSRFVLSSTPWNDLGISDYLGNGQNTTENAMKVLGEVESVLGADCKHESKDWLTISHACRSHTDLDAWMAYDASRTQAVTLEEAEKWANSLKASLSLADWRKALARLAESGKVRVPPVTPREEIEKKIIDPDYEVMLEKYRACVGTVKTRLQGEKTIGQKSGRNFVSLTDLESWVTGAGYSEPRRGSSGRFGTRVDCGAIFAWFEIEPKFLPSTDSDFWTRAQKKPTVEEIEKNRLTVLTGAAEGSTATLGPQGQVCREVSKNLVDQFLGLELSPYPYSYDGVPVSQSFYKMSSQMYGFAREAMRTNAYRDPIDARRKKACEKFNFSS